MNYKAFRILLTIFLMVTVAFSVFSQDGGVSSIFSKGVGARQIGLGGAVVAYPQDPTTIFWNPAGLEYLQQKSFSMYYATYLAGAYFNFAGYVHPTLNMGTFGLGVSRIAIGDLIERPPENYTETGRFSFEQSEFYLSYGKIIRNFISVGVNIKFERFVMYDSSDVGFGGDLSLMYLPEVDNFLLRDIRLGFTVVNAYSPRLNPGDATDYIPQRLLFGFAKPLIFGDGQKPLVWLFSIDRGENEGLKVRTGLEYSYQNLGMLRIGYNADDKLSFGAGASYGQFQFDYTYGSLANRDFGAGHRISFSVQFGKTKSELLEIVNARRNREIAEQVADEKEQERRARMEELLTEGRQLYGEKKYFLAKVNFEWVFNILDPGNLDAEDMMDQCDARLEEIQIQESLEQLAEIADNDRKQTAEIFNRHHTKGRAFLSDGNFNAAIQEFRLALQQLPNDENTKEQIRLAETAQEDRIADLIAKADEFGKKEDYTEAINYLRQARLLSLDEEAQLELIMARIAEFQDKIRVLDYYRTGLMEYKAENWAEARTNFEEARKRAPNDPEIARFFKEAERREKAVDQDILPKMQDKYTRAFNFYMVGKYHEAIDIWQDLLLIQPYNLRIIRNIDEAEKDLERLKDINN